MIIQKHDLIHEFPELKDAIHHLKLNDKHFAKMFDQYHELDHEIHRIEQGSENTGDVYLENKKKERLLLKDKLYAIIKAQPAIA